jgi:NitT/TauT family transport system permease protein
MDVNPEITPRDALAIETGRHAGEVRSSGGSFDWHGLLLKALRVGLFYLALLGLWQLVYELEIWPPYVIPSPSEVWDSFKQYWDNGLIQDGIVVTMQRLLLGYGISLLVGMTVGMAAGTWKYIDETVGSLVLGLQSLPSITWIPLAILWFGLNENAIIFIVFMGSVFAVAISARAGVKGLPPLYRKAALTMGANRYQMTRYVLLPAMVPAMAQGLKLGWSFAWRSLMAAEIVFVVAGDFGIGHLLNLGRDLNDMSLVIAIMIVIVAIGLAFDVFVFSRLESWVKERWGYAAA